MGGSSQSKNVKPSEFFEEQGLKLPDDATRDDIMRKVCDPGEGFELSEHGFIQERGLSAKDLQVGNKILQELEEGIGEAAAQGEDPLAQMLRNFDVVSKKFKEEGKINLTYIQGEEREKSLEVETFNVGSIVQVSNSLVASLVTGFGLPVGLSKALVFPKIAEFLRGLSEVYENKKESYDLKQFTVQFVKIDKEMKCTSVTAYRFRFASSDQLTKYWIFGTKSDSTMWVYCRKATFLCTNTISEDGMLD